jgi:hypothetical protein
MHEGSDDLRPASPHASEPFVHGPAALIACPPVAISLASNLFLVEAKYSLYPSLAPRHLEENTKRHISSAPLRSHDVLHSAIVEPPVSI